MNRKEFAAWVMSHADLPEDQSHAEQLLRAFVEGAKWWEFESTGVTMWQRDQEKAWAEAEKRLGDGTLGQPNKMEAEDEARRENPA